MLPRQTVSLCVAKAWNRDLSFVETATAQCVWCALCVAAHVLHSTHTPCVLGVPFPRCPLHNLLNPCCTQHKGGFQRSQCTGLSPTSTLVSNWAQTQDMSRRVLIKYHAVMPEMSCPMRPCTPRQLVLTITSAPTNASSHTSSKFHGTITGEADSEVWRPLRSGEEADCQTSVNTLESIHASQVCEAPSTNHWCKKQSELQHGLSMCSTCRTVTAHHMSYNHQRSIPSSGRSMPTQRTHVYTFNAVDLPLCAAFVTYSTMLRSKCSNFWYNPHCQ
jgi:hypothetical protein